MEEMKYSPPLNTTTTISTAATNREQEKFAMSRIKKACLAFGVSLQEGFRYVKAILVGTRNEKEATAAALQAQKMQVEAANEAENTKETIYKSK
ncbi:hypothetical protein CRYUN_Cryun28dG0064200 [Craigia yunnanensis]